MAIGGSVELVVRRWAAWAPGVEDAASWDRWAKGEATIAGSVEPDVSFVSPLQRRRLSEASRMAFAVAAQCMEDADAGAPWVFCSRYGEYPRSFEILQDLARQQPASPTAFSMSVHNTAASQFSIHRRDRSQFTALAAGEATLEAAFVEAWCRIGQATGGSVLLVYHDQPLPDLYRQQATTVTHSLALALLLSRPTADAARPILRLAWHPGPGDPAAGADAANPVLAVIRLLHSGDGPVAQDTGRLVWTWSRPGAET